MNNVILSNSGIDSCWCNQVAYSHGLEIQMSHYEKVLNRQHPGTVLGLEHKAVVTLGKRAILKEDVKISSQELQSLDMDLAQIDRGGHATLHTPGQLVIYPIVNLRYYNLNVRTFISLLELTTQKTLQEYRIETFKSSEEPGLYTTNGKIAFFGIRIDRGISRHGISLNVKNDLNLFNVIRSCGIQNERFDKVELYQSQIETKEVFSRWYKQFINYLNLTDKFS